MFQMLKYSMDNSHSMDGREMRQVMTMMFSNFVYSPPTVPLVANRGSGTYGTRYIHISIEELTCCHQSALR